MTVESTIEGRIAAAQAQLSAALWELQHRDPPWFSTARGELGVKELPGDAHEARVLEYLATCHLGHGGNLGTWAAGRDETPWCSAFVNWCMLRSGISPTRDAAARSWLKWGRDSEPRRGAVAVLTRGRGGHVAFLDRIEGACVYLLGGNQGNRVSVAQYKASRVLSYRWPLEAK